MTAKTLTFFLPDTRHCEHCKLPSHHEVSRTVDRYKMKFNIRDETCDQRKTKILIINRSTNRKIINIEELINNLIFNTSEDVETIAMETLSIREQIQKVHCTDVFIGVHGAGLTWHVNRISFLIDFNKNFTLYTFFRLSSNTITHFTFNCRATFMRPHTHLIEISWPTAGGLDFFYTKPGQYYNNIFSDV